MDYIKDKLLRELLGGMSRTTLWRRIRDGSIPKPLKLSEGKNALNYFRESWIHGFIRDLNAG